MIGRRGRDWQSQVAFGRRPVWVARRHPPPTSPRRRWVSPDRGDQTANFRKAAPFEFLAPPETMIGIGSAATGRGTVLMAGGRLSRMERGE